MIKFSSTEGAPDAGHRGSSSPAMPVTPVTIDGVEYHLARLRWRARNRVVHRAVDVDERGVELRPMSFGQALLAASLTAVVRRGEARPVTQAWLDEVSSELGDRLIEAAVAANRRQVLAIEEGPRCERGTTVYVRGASYCLGPWTWGLRSRLLDRAVRGEAKGGRTSEGAIDAARFHERVLAGTCVRVDGRRPAPTWLDELDADVGDALLEYILEAGELDEPGADDLAEAVRSGRPHDGVTLYTLCREFGWTPAELREQRAVDVDALMAVHRARQELTAAPAGATSSTRAGASAPDETVILVADDPE